MNVKKVLVTGALGMLGKEFVREYLRIYPNDILKLVDVFPIHEFQDFLSELPISSHQWEYRQLDILDENELRKVLVDCDVIYHLAGIISYDKAMIQKMFQVNVEGTKLLVRLAAEARVQKIIYASSISAIALLSGSVATEEDYPSASAEYLNNYSKSKLKAEEDFFAIRSDKMDKVAANLGVIIGVNKQFTSIRKWLRILPIFPLLPTYNSYVDVRDAVGALILLGARGVSGERYIVTAYNITNAEFITAYARELGRQPFLLPIPTALLGMIFGLLKRLGSRVKSDAWRSVKENKRFSINKIKKLGWSPKYSLVNSLAHLVAEMKKE